MKKRLLETIIILLALFTLQAGCNTQEPKTDTGKLDVVNPRDSLKIYLEAKKMAITAYTMAHPGYYDSALGQYNKCIAFLNKALLDNNNKGMYLYATEIIEINQGMEAVYDSLKQPENALKCTLACLHWAKVLHDYSLQIKFDMNVAAELKNMAGDTINDTAKKGALGREALQYAIAGGRVIDSLRTIDMDDLRYEDFHLTSKIFALLGNQKQAYVFDKKYKDLYFRIFNRLPENN